MSDQYKPDKPEVQEEPSYYNVTLLIVVIVISVLVILFAIIFFLRCFSKYVERRVQDRIDREEGLQPFRNQIASEVDFGSIIIFASDLNRCSLPQTDEIYSEQDQLTPDYVDLPPPTLPPPSPADGTAADMAADVIPPPMSSDERLPSPNPDTMVRQDGTRQQSPSCQRDVRSLDCDASPPQPSVWDISQDIAQPPTSSGDPHFTDTQQRAEFIVGPPPPYTPPGVPAPPHEAYTTATPPSYEESLDHTVL